MTRKEQIENHFKGGEKTNQNLIALQVYVKNYIQRHFPPPYTRYEIIQDSDVQSRAYGAVIDLLRDKPSFLMELTQADFSEFNFEIDYKYKADMRSAFRIELYKLSDIIRNERKRFKRSEYFSYDTKTKVYTIEISSPLFAHPLVRQGDYSLKKDDYGTYDLFLKIKGSNERVGCFSSLIEASQMLSDELDKAYERMPILLNDACHRGEEDLFCLCRKDYRVRMLSDKVLTKFIDSYERPEPRKYGVYKNGNSRYDQFFVDANEADRIKLGGQVADIVVDNIPHKAASDLCRSLLQAKDLYEESNQSNYMIDKLTKRIEEEQAELDSNAFKYIELSEELKKDYNIDINDIIKKEAES